MKQTRRCPKCKSPKIGRLDEVPDQVHERRERSKPYQAQTLGLAARRSKGTQGVIGKLEAYVCGHCGYYETYVKDPLIVPFDAIAGFTWLDEAAPEGPYR